MRHSHHGGAAEAAPLVARGRYTSPGPDLGGALPDEGSSVRQQQHRAGGRAGPWSSACILAAPEPQGNILPGALFRSQKGLKPERRTAAAVSVEYRARRCRPVEVRPHLHCYSFCCAPHRMYCRRNGARPRRGGAPAARPPAQRAQLRRARKKNGNGCGGEGRSGKRRRRAAGGRAGGAP